MTIPINVTKLSLKLTDNVKILQDKINRGIADHINALFVSNERYTENQVLDLVGVWIRSQPEMVSLALSGDDNSLAGHFGLPAGTANSVANTIVTSIQQATRVVVKKVDNKLNGGLILECQPSNFANLLGLPTGYTEVTGGSLHWLKWLLESGHKTLIVDYHYTPASGFGRSRLGVMTKGGAWRVPPEFAGTIEDNFVTRAFKNKQNDLNALFGRILKS